LQFEANWDLALRVLPLLTSAQLPEMSSDTSVSSDLLLDVATNVFECQIEKWQLERMDNFCQNPPHFELVELVDEHGHCCGYEKLKMSKEGRKRLEVLADLPAETIQDNKKAESKAKMLYLLAHYHM
jgi:hypothetical protein